MLDNQGAVWLKGAVWLTGRSVALRVQCGSLGCSVAQGCNVALKVQYSSQGAVWLEGAVWLIGCSVVRGCSVAQLVARWLAVRQVRVRISARHPNPMEVPPTEPTAVKICRWASANVYE
jgi:hypothetical protein